MFSIAPYSSTPYCTLADSFLEAGAQLDSLSLFDTDSKVKYQIGGLLEVISQTDLSSKIKIYQISNPIQIDANLDSSGKILLISNSSIDVNAIFTSEYLTRTIGVSDLIESSNFDVDSYIKILDSISIEVDSNLDAILGAVYSNSANFDVLGIMSSNLSHRNRDIVYYILAINKEEPFILNILRAK